jgi:hypothetical protein
MEDSNLIIKFVGIVSLVAVFAVVLNQWDSGSAQVDGWEDLKTNLTTDPFTNLTSMPNWPQWNTTGNCQWWDIICLGLAAMSYIAGVLVYIATVVWIIGEALWLGFIWFILLIVSFFSSLFTVATLTFSGFPVEIQTILWVIILPMLVLVVVVIIRFIRGQ